MQIPGSEKLLEVASGADRGNRFANLLKKTGLSKAAMSSFGEPELLDDLVDHWNAGNHKEVYLFVPLSFAFACVLFLSCGMQRCFGIPRSILLYLCILQFWTSLQFQLHFTSVIPVCSYYTYSLKTVVCHLSCC